MSLFGRVEFDGAILAFSLNRDGDHVFSQQFVNFSAKARAAGGHNDRYLVVASGDNGVGCDFSTLSAIEPVATPSGARPGVLQHCVLGASHR